MPRLQQLTLDVEKALGRLDITQILYMDGNRLFSLILLGLTYTCYLGDK